MKKKDILFLLASSVILVIAWITFTLIHNSLSSTINETVSGQIAPIPGTFDTQAIAKLKKREQVTSLFAATQSAALTPTLTPTPSPAATPSATLTPDITPNPTATQGGNKT